MTQPSKAPSATSHMSLGSSSLLKGIQLQASPPCKVNPRQMEPGLRFVFSPLTRVLFSLELGQEIGKDQVRHSMRISLSGSIFTELIVDHILKRCGREDVLESDGPGWESTLWDLLFFVILILVSRACFPTCQIGLTGIPTWQSFCENEARQSTVSRGPDAHFP